MIQAGFAPTTGHIGVAVTDEEKRDNAGNALNKALQTAPGVGNRSEMDSNADGAAASDPIATASDPLLSEAR